MITPAERALAGAVRAHQRVRFAAADRQIHAVQDRLAFDGNMQIRNLQCLSHCSVCKSFQSSVISRMPQASRDATHRRQLTP